jgi:YNFM family putative membrane transporter
MGAYTASLTFGGLVGRVGTALIAGWVGWRWALGALVVPVVLGALAMWAWLPRDAPHPVRRPLGEAISDHLHNRLLVTNAVVAAAAFFGYVGLFTYASYRLTSPAIGLSIGESGLVYGVWVVGAAVPLVGHLAQRAGPARLLPSLTGTAIAGAVLTLVPSLPVLILGLAMTAFAMFSIVTTCQILLPRLVDHHRGTATSLHLTIYYLAGGAGAYLPGLRLSSGWAAVVEVCLASFAVGTAAAVLLRLRLGPGVALGHTAE